MILVTHEFHSPNPEIKKYVDSLSRESQVICWEFYNFIINEMPETQRFLFGELKSREEERM